MTKKSNIIHVILRGMEAPSLIANAYGMVHQRSGEKYHQKELYQKKAS